MIMIPIKILPFDFKGAIMNPKNVLVILTAAALTACGGGSSSNSAPTFTQSSYSLTTSEDLSATLSVTATDENSKDTLTYGLANASANASIDVNSTTGEITYTPVLNFNGQDSFAVNVSDGSESVTVTVNVTVTPVNDAPELAAETIFVSGSEIKKGQLSASDVDGDVLSYSVTETTQNGELVVDAVTGEVTYTPTNLVDINDSFTVMVSDGNGGELTKALTVSSNLATNADRAYYYYASEQSHLKQAETHITSLTNDINQGLVFSNLAIGYAEAGLFGQVERLVTEEQIVRTEIRARALLDVSEQYNALGALEKADAYRSQANALYTEYVASKGISSFDNTDAKFFTDLSKAYADVGENDKSQQVLSILDLLFATALEGEGTTAALRTFFAYRNLVDDVVEQWQYSQQQADFELAYDMTTRLYSYANQIGFRYVSNNRNGNEGEIYHSVRQLALADVVTAFIDLNDFEKAKEPLHDLLALYGITGIDENFSREASEYAPVTRVEYQYGLYGIVDDFVVLYPENDLTPLLAGFPEGSFWGGRAPEAAGDAKLMAQVRNMTDKNAALALVIAARAPDNLRNHFTNLVAFNSSSPGGAIYLRQQGEYQAASAFLAEAMTVLTSNDYISQNIANEAFVTGQTGCTKVLDELLTLYRLSGNESYKEQAQTALGNCLVIAKTHFSDGVDGGDVEIDNAIHAHARYLAYAERLTLTEEDITSLKANIESNLEKVADTSYATQIAHLRYVAEAAATGANFTDAQAYYDRALAQLNLYEAAQISEEVGAGTIDVFDEYEDYLELIEKHAGTLEGYTDIRTNAYNAWVKVVDLRLATLAEAAVQQKLTYLPNYAEQFMRLGLFDRAQAIASDDVLGTVEQEAIITNLALNLSIKDDFRQTIVASVDTDGDGKANFFLETADDSAIENAGIALDEDSDNDGIDDADDAFPLDPTKQ